MTMTNLLSLCSSGELFWLVVALVGPLLWMPIRSFFQKRRRKRRKSNFISGGPLGNYVTTSDASKSSEGLFVLLRWLWDQLVASLEYSYYCIKNKLKRSRNQNRVTFAEHSTGQVREERYHFHHEDQPNHPVVPDIHTPSPVPTRSQSQQAKPRLLAPNTPPPKVLRKKQRAAAAAQQQREKESSTRMKTTPSGQTPSPASMDRRSLTMHQYQTSPFISQSVRAMKVSTTPLSIQYQQQRSARKRRYEETEVATTSKRPRIPLKATSNINNGRLPLRRSSLAKKRNRASTEAWLLEEFSRRKKPTTTTPPTTSATPQQTNATPATGTSETKPAFVFGGGETPPAAADSKPAATETPSTNAATPDASTQAPATGGFGFGSDKNAAAPAADTSASASSGFTFGQSSRDDSDTKAPATSTPAAAGGFTFGQAPTAVADSSNANANPPATLAPAPSRGFTFGQQAAGDNNAINAKPQATSTPAPSNTGGFTSGQAPSEAADGTSSTNPQATSISTPAPSTAANTTKPPASAPTSGGFTFGQQASGDNAADSIPPATSTPAPTGGFSSFGQSATTAPQATPAPASAGGFSFGQTPGAPSGSSTTPSFGQTSSNTTAAPLAGSQPTGGFQFGVATPKPDGPPQATSTQTGSNFNYASTTTPNFSLGSGAQTAPPSAPSFGAGPPSMPNFGSTSAVPSFGATAAPSFSTGATPSGGGGASLRRRQKRHGRRPR